jgi:hypothetical protein
MNYKFYFVNDCNKNIILLFKRTKRITVIYYNIYAIHNVKFNVCYSSSNKNMSKL